MKKCPNCKNPGSSKVKTKSITCKTCGMKHSCCAKLSGMSLNEKKSDISTKCSTSSLSSKGRKIQDKECSCTKKPKEPSVLNMITEDKVCICDIFAKALRSDIHMNLGTYIHQDGSASNSNENCMEY